MEWQQIIEALGGGVPAVVIAALAWAWRYERNRNAFLQDARIDDHKAHTAQMIENVRSLDAAIKALEKR